MKVVVALLAFALVGFFVIFFSPLGQSFRQSQTLASPSPTPASSSAQATSTPKKASSSPKPTMSPKTKATATPVTSTDGSSGKLTLDVPFLVQAPNANWDALHEEACEEASLINVLYYLQKRVPANRDAGEQEIQDLVKYETEHGYKVDVTLQELNQIAKDFYGLTTGRVETQVTLATLKRELKAGHPIIVGAAGKILPNPHFKNGGPKYHMLVIKGYDDNRSINPKECRITAQATCSQSPGVFITNDVGIWQGNSFLYTYDDMLTSIHNWDEGDILTGQKAYLVFD